MPASMSVFAETIYKQKYAEPGEVWHDNGVDSTSTARRVVTSVMGDYLPELVEPMIGLISERKAMPGGRYLYCAGKAFPQVNNCLLLTVDDSREGWADLMRRITQGLMTGAGIGIVYSQLRERGALVRGMGGTSTGPIALAQMVNEAGRHIMQGGSRRSAIWGGLHWNHPDIMEWIYLKNWKPEIKAMKEADFNASAPMDGTNISVILDDDFFLAYHDPSHSEHARAQEVYWSTVNNMLETGEPGFSVDVGVNAGEHLRNACCELTSSDDNDICNLGSLNLAQFDSIDDFREAVQITTAFLLCGTLYSKVPYEEVATTRSKNRRLGLGLMGIYEWLLVRGKPYGPDDELGEWLAVYRDESRKAADAYSEFLGVNAPVKVRAIAPTGTIGILAETTTGIEPMMAAAFKRRYLKGTTWHYQYVVDATARRLLDKGVDPSLMEDAYDLSHDPARRLEFQAWVQQYVDHAISSTLNLPPLAEQPFDPQKFGDILMDVLPKLRGVTVYPDGARGGQPITKVPLAEALDWEGFEIEEAGNAASCVSGACGV